jgi:hypothetical protein
VDTDKDACDHRTTVANCIFGIDSNSVLVPLTNSLYVRGELANSDSVLVDVGTGFLVEKVCGAGCGAGRAGSTERATVCEAELTLRIETEVCDAILREKGQGNGG